MAKESIMKLIIFDFEGTLVDFQWKLKEAVDTILEILDQYRINHNILWDEEKYKNMNYSLLYNHFLESIDDAYLRKKIMDEFDRIYDYYDEDASKRWSLYHDVPETLDKLKRKKYKIALDSNVGRKALDKMLKKFMIDKYFDITISRNDVNFLKPHPEGIFKILNFFKDYYFEDKYFVGDSVTDIKTAKESKKDFKIISIVNGEDKIERLMSYNPYHLIHSISELLKLL